MIAPCPLPETALLRRYADSGAYTDCYTTDIRNEVTHAAFVAAFYTTRVFRLERAILRWVAARPSTDSEARQLAAGQRDSFAAWDVEQRGENQLLLTDMHGRTRSWLMTAPAAAGGGTRLYFGSAVIRTPAARGGRPALTPALALAFRLLMPFHRRYSVILLGAARRALQARGG